MNTSRPRTGNLNPVVSGAGGYHRYLEGPAIGEAKFPGWQWAVPNIVGNLYTPAAQMPRAEQAE